MSLDGSYVYPRDISKYVVRIDGEDYSNIVPQTEIYEDILSPFWTCTLAVFDTQNYIMNHPFYTGMEIEIELKTEGPAPYSGKKIFTFVCYKIGERVAKQRDQYYYQLYGISKEYFQEQKVRISKSYQQRSGVEIAKDACSQAGIAISKPSNDQNKYNLIVPNLSPVATAEWCCSFAKDKGADFFFYQWDSGAYTMRTLDDMFQDDTQWDLVQMNPNMGIKGKPAVDHPEAYKNIEGFNFLNHHDSIPNVVAGVYGNKVISHDIVNKTYKETKYTYSQDQLTDLFLKNFHGDAFNNVENSNISFTPVHPDVSDNGRVNNQTHEEWKGSRKSHILKVETNKLLVDIPGHTVYADKIGRMINVKLPSQQDLNDMKYDKHLEGNYVISAIKHIATNKEYHIHMELIKKRLRNKLDLS